MSRPRLVALLLALVTLLLYLPVRHADFVNYDDNDYVTENRTVQQGLTVAGLKWAFSFHASNWHPVTWLSHMLDCELFGLNPSTQHLVNVLWHVTNAVLLFGLLLRLMAHVWPAAMVAALFAWHPLHVESVAWVAERKDVLSTCFALLALRAYHKFAVGADQSNPGQKRYYWLSLTFFAVGLMAKPMLVTLPFVLLLLDWWPLKRTASLTRRLVEKWPYFLLTLVSCVVTILAQRSMAMVALERLPLGLRLENAVVAYVCYLFKTIWPTKLAVIYPLPKEISSAVVLAAIALLGGLSLLCWRTRQRKPWLLVGWFWYLGMLVPVIGLVQVGGQAMADRYTYLPLVGIFIAVIFEVRDFVTRHQLKPGLIWLTAMVLLVGCLAGAARQLRVWQNSETLFQHAVAATANNPIARINLGVALDQSGRRDEALEQYEIALRLDPGRVQIHNNLAALFDELGRNDEAFSHYQEALRLQPDAPLAHANFGTLLVKLGRFEKAMREYATAVRLAPDDLRPHYLMGKAELKRGNPEAAITEFREAVRLDGNDFQSLALLARIRASAADSRLRDGNEAVSLARRASELTGGGQPFVLDALAMAYAEAQQFDRAQELIAQAIGIAVAAGESNLVPELQLHGQAFQSGRPWREKDDRN